MLGNQPQLGALITLMGGPVLVGVKNKGSVDL